jgi:hypothetical protein
MLNKDNKPTETEILEYIGDSSPLWVELRSFIEKNYDFLPETIFYGKKYGWTIRYRKGGRTLSSLFPEQGAFTVLIVLGKKEVDKLFAQIETLHDRAKSIFENAKQLRDGRWLWIRVLGLFDIDSIKSIIKIKRKPKTG